MTGKDNRLNFRMTDDTAAKIERWYRQDNCRSKNEFIEKAVNFYTDMLSAGDNSMLPMAIQSAIDGRLKLFEDRMAALLFKQTVETDMGLSILLQSVNVDEEVLRQERAKSNAGNCKMRQTIQVCRWMSGTKPCGNWNGWLKWETSTRNISSAQPIGMAVC